MPRPRLLRRPTAPNGAGDGIRTRDIQLGRLELYQLSYARLVPGTRGPGARSHMVGREGFEPSKAVGRQIYSLMRLTASLPPRLSRRALANRARAVLGTALGSGLSWRRELNPRPADYKSAALPLSYASDKR